MNDLKFRAHNKKFKTTEDVDVIDFGSRCVLAKVNGVLSNWHFDDIDLMQYSGKKDKNSDMIFEGDKMEYSIFDYNDQDTQFIGIVKYVGSEFIITQIPDTFCNGGYGVNLAWMIDQDCEAEIIGNIHNENN